MNQETILFKDVRKEYCNFIDHMASVCCYTVSKRIQEFEVNNCGEYLRIIKTYKQQAINCDNEEHANQFFHMQCMVNAIRSGLLMFVSLKNDEYLAAWQQLIDAQEYISVALKITDYEGVRVLEKRLQSFEDTLFPKWELYNSPGYTGTIGNCSICHKPFTECEHIENQIYMGSLCQRVNIKDIEINHIALVKKPRDRRCVLFEYSEKGKMIDKFTQESIGDIVENEENMTVHGVVFKYPAMDFN